MANLPVNINAPFLFNGVEQFIGKNIFCLFAGCSNGAAVAVSTLQDSTGTAYQVPIGKTLVIVNVFLISDVTSTSLPARIGYGDNSVNNSASNPTSAILALMYLNAKGYDYSSVFPQFPTKFKVPALKYPFMRKDNSALSILYGTVWCYLE